MSRSKDRTKRRIKGSSGAKRHPAEQKVTFGNYKEILERIADEYPEALKMDDYDDCIVGVCHRFGMPVIIIYDQQKVLEKLIKMGCKDMEEAVEFYEYNQLGAWLGDHTPCFLERF